MAPPGRGDRGERRCGGASSPCSTTPGGQRATDPTTAPVPPSSPDPPGPIVRPTDPEFRLLHPACARPYARAHPPAVDPSGLLGRQTGWTSGGFGIMPHPSRLCTEAAGGRRRSGWTDGRASLLVVPEFVKDEWGIGPLAGTLACESSPFRRGQAAAHPSIRPGSQQRLRFVFHGKRPSSWRASSSLELGLGPRRPPCGRSRGTGHDPLTGPRLAPCSPGGPSVCQSSRPASRRASPGGPMSTILCASQCRRHHAAS